MSERERFDGTIEEMDRAIRRLNVFELILLGFTVLLALLGGGAVAFILTAGTDLPFRLVWGAISLALLIIPGIIVYGREALRGRNRGVDSRDTQRK